jgi:hypothetical protein
MNSLSKIAYLTLVTAILFGGCVTRTEVDYYTITVRDSTVRSQVRNAPGSNDDNGVVFPTSRTTTIHRETISYDSTHERNYPAFLRYGGLEFASFFTGAAGPGFGAGFLGVYTLFDSTRNPIYSAENNAPKKDQTTLFRGHLFRIVPLEYQLHWFDESPDWTIGINMFESIAQNGDATRTLNSIASNLYIRKRYWLRDKKPFLFITPFFGLSLLPSAYINFGGEITFGSYGGFNLKGYLGLASGFTWGAFTNSNQTLPAVTTPYVGIGVSALDFINTTSDLAREWKDYAHSAVEISVFDADLIYATAGYPNLFDTAKVHIPLTGAVMQLATAHFPLNNLWNGKFWVGTSLFKFFGMGYNQVAMSVLPLRIGYRQYLIAEDLTLEPQIELNYYPSPFANISARLRLNTFKDITVGFVLGYASGSTGAFLPTFFYQNGSTDPTKFNTFYLGVSFGLKDRLYTPEKVKEMDSWPQ